MASAADIDRRWPYFLAGEPDFVKVYLQESAAEVAALARAGLFTNLELLTMWSVTTPRSIFPERRIDVLEAGYEASFLVLCADPLADMAATHAISLRVKQGVPIPFGSVTPFD